MTTPRRLTPGSGIPGSTCREPLAIHGGRKVRVDPMPPRAAFGQVELVAIQRVFEASASTGIDFGYQGPFEKAYTDAFVAYLGAGGFADGVCSGTAALFVALAALELPKQSHVLVSPVTDPGTLNAIILNDLVPVLVDSEPGTYNMGPAELEARITPESRAVVVVHAGGKPAPIEAIAGVAKIHGLQVVEDCSQAHGARIGNRKVGTFSDLAVFSTMYTKAHATGGCGGLVYTPDEHLHHLARAHADRGKAYWLDGFSDRDPRTNLFPALNLNLDEISCAVGLSTLSRLEEVRTRRVAFLTALRDRLLLESRCCRPTSLSEGDSPYFYDIAVLPGSLTCSKIQFAEAIQAEGIPIRAHYPCLAAEWPYLAAHLADSFGCPHARRHQSATFNLMFNENFGERELTDIMAAIVKVEAVYAG